MPVVVVKSEKGRSGAYGNVLTNGFVALEDDGLGGMVGVPLRAGGRGCEVDEDGMAGFSLTSGYGE